MVQASVPMVDNTVCHNTILSFCKLVFIWYLIFLLKRYSNQVITFQLKILILQFIGVFKINILILSFKRLFKFRRRIPLLLIIGYCHVIPIFKPFFLLHTILLRVCFEKKSIKSCRLNGFYFIAFNISLFRCNVLVSFLFCFPFLLWINYIFKIIFLPFKINEAEPCHTNTYVQTISASSMFCTT